MVIRNWNVTQEAAVWPKAEIQLTRNESHLWRSVSRTDTTTPKLHRNIKSAKITHRHSILSLALRKNNVVILTTFSYSAAGKSTSCRSPCMDFLPPSGGVFRLSFSGSSPGIPCRRSCGFQGPTGKTATKKPSQNRPALPSLFLEGHASRLCNGWKPKCSAPQGRNEYVKICYIQLLR